MTIKDKVSDWMTREPVTIDEHASIIETAHLMKEKNVRRLPVMHHGELVGAYIRENPPHVTGAPVVFNPRVAGRPLSLDDAPIVSP